MVCIALTAAGLLLGAVFAARRRFLTATRWVAAALLPVGVYLTGLAPVVSDIGRTLWNWGTDVVLGTRVWTGLGLLALSMVLFAAARTAGRRRAARRAASPAGERGAPHPVVAPRSALDHRSSADPAHAEPRPKTVSRPKTEPQPPGGARPQSKSAGKGADDDLGDFSEIEEILRRRGI